MLLSCFRLKKCVVTLKLAAQQTILRRNNRGPIEYMAFSSFDEQTSRLLSQVFDGAMMVLNAMKSEALADGQRQETIARITTQLVNAASEGQRDFQILQLKALEGIN